MNRLEHYFCASSFWRRITQEQLVPWLVADSALGDHVLEIGAGYGAATAFLRDRAARVTSLEYDARTAARLASHGGAPPIRGDAAALPFADEAFSSVVAILVLHHLKSREEQERAFAEAFRVLRPGGVFLAVEIADTWLHRAVHFKSVFTAIDPGNAEERLARIGFVQISSRSKSGGFRLRAARPAA